jgi:hypothetical protein
VTDGPHVVVGRNLATSAPEFVARLETNDVGDRTRGREDRSFGFRVFGNVDLPFLVT